MEVNLNLCTMILSDIISMSAKPKIYTPGTSFMWDDQYISKQLLAVHLNPDIDLASRKRTTITTTVEWILDMSPKHGKLDILDLGCGPGLYTELFAQKGHTVTGVDISKTSIAHAKKSAEEKGLDITYIEQNYLDMELVAEQFDLVTLIYTDFGVLTPKDREKLLQLIFRVLKSGGTFIFDVLRDADLDLRIAPKDWEASRSGFWKNEPYVVLSNSFLYQNEKVILYQHLVIDSKDNLETYRFWTRFFSEEDLFGLLIAHKFSNIKFQDDVIPSGDLWGGKNVLFGIAAK